MGLYYLSLLNSYVILMIMMILIWKIQQMDP